MKRLKRVIKAILELANSIAEAELIAVRKKYRDKVSYNQIN